MDDQFQVLISSSEYNSVRDTLTKREEQLIVLEEKTKQFESQISGFKKDALQTHKKLTSQISNTKQISLEGVRLTKKLIVYEEKLKNTEVDSAEQIKELAMNLKECILEKRKLEFATKQTFEAKNQQLAKAIGQLEAMKTTFKKEKESQSLRIASLDSDLIAKEKQAQIQLRENQQALQRLSQTVRKLEEENMRITEEYELLEVKQAQSEAQRAELQKTTQEISLKLDETTQELSTKLKKSIIELKSAESQSENLRISIKQRENENNELMSTIAFLENNKKELEQAQVELNSEIQSQDKIFCELKETTNQKNEENNKQLHKLTKNLKETTNQLQKLKQQNLSYKGQVNEFQKEIKNLKEKNNSLDLASEENNNLFTSKIISLELQLTEAQQLNEERQTIHKIERQDLSRQISGLQQSIEEKETRLAILDSQSDNEKQKHKKDKQDADQKIRILEVQLRDSHKELDELCQKLQKSYEQQDEVKLKRFQLFQEEKQQSEKRIKELEVKVEALTKQKSKLVKESKNQVAKFNKMEKQLNEERRIRSELENVIKTLNEEKKALEVNYTIQQSSEKHIKPKEQQTQELQILQQRYSKLQKQREKLSSANQKLKVTNYELKKDMEDVMNLNIKLEQTLKEKDCKGSITRVLTATDLYYSEKLATLLQKEKTQEEIFISLAKEKSDLEREIENNIYTKKLEEVKQKCSKTKMTTRADKKKTDKVEK